MGQGWISKALDGTFQPERYRWYHALGFGAMVNLASGFSGRRAEDRRFYESFEQASFAPPSWAFAPVWAANNASTLWGNLRLLNQPEDATNRKALLVLQAASWFLFSTFSYVYFRKRSPILAFIWTAAMWLLTVASVLLSLENDRKIALSLGSLLAWLTLATPVAAYQAARNPDELLGYQPQGR
jgi:benzodiazapine receptor